MLFLMNAAKKSVSLKLLLYILAFSTLITLLTTAVNIYSDYSTEMDLIAKRIENIRKSNLQSLSQSLWYMDSAYAKTQLNGLLQLPDIQYLEITSRVQENNISVGSPQTTNSIVYDFPLRYVSGGKEFDLGDLQIVVDLNELYHRILDKIFIILVTQAFKTFVVSGFIFIIVQWVVTRHLENISRFVEQLSFDSLEPELTLNQPEKEENELTRVVEAVNSMKNELDKNIRLLRKSENRYRALIKNAPIVILHLSPSGDILDLNPEAELLYGEDRDEIVGQNYITKTFPEASRDKVSRDIINLEGKGAVKSFEESVVDSRGDARHLFWNVARFLDDKDELFGIVAIGLDITESKRMESQLRQAQKLESVGRLAGGVAHDFNNMLTIILGYSTMIMENLEPGAPLYDEIQEIHEAGARSADITRQLLAFARKQTVSPKSLDLNDSIDSMLKMLQRLLGEDVDVAWLPEQSLWSVKIDPSQLDQILANLCVNARDAMEGGAG